MIFLDTNIFMRYLAPPTDEATRTMNLVATELFARVKRGEIEVTTSEVVLHEVFFVLTSRKQYGLPAYEAIQMVSPLIQENSFKFEPGERRIYLRAMDLLEDNSHLGFADCVIAARSEKPGVELATFDEQLGSLSNVRRWKP